MEFHRLKRSELDSCVLLIEENFGSDHAKAFRAEATAKEGHDFYTLSEKDTVLACGAFTYSPCDDRTFESYYVCVRKSEQRKGLGFQLMHNMIKKAMEDEEADFVIQTCKKHLKPMYEKLGFFVLHERTDEFLMGMKLR